MILNLLLANVKMKTGEFERIFWYHLITSLYSSTQNFWKDCLTAKLWWLCSGNEVNLQIFAKTLMYAELKLMSFSLL